MVAVFEWASSQASAISKSVSVSFAPANKSKRDVDNDFFLVIAFSILCVVVPMEVGQLTFAFVGAVAYAIVQAMRKSTKSKLKTKSIGQRKKVDDEYVHAREAVVRPPRTYNTEQRRQSAQERAVKKSHGIEEYRQPSVVPVTAPTFKGERFEEQVAELVKQISPTPQGDKVMKDLAAAARKLLRDFLPEAEVVAFASADITRGTAFGVAIPEVDMILNATPGMLAERLQCRAARPILHAASLDARKLQKSALRACTDDLVVGGTFKFRRSAFKGLEPKVTLLATGFHSTGIPVDFSINTVTPLYNTALLSECAQIDTRAKELILLVRRWAKDRAVSHAAKGHLSPYAWSLLAIYFMQVWNEKENVPALLPALKSFKVASKLVDPQCPQTTGIPNHGTSATSVATVFKEFIAFYARTFNYRNEAISVRAGARKPPSAKLPLHIVELGDGSTQLAPCVEDPFEPTRNLSSLMTTVSLCRFKEEFMRADAFCSRDASLTELLEPWVPPERGNKADEQVGDDSPVDEA